MKPKDALNLLKDYNAWRRGEPSNISILNMQTEKIGIAIDMAIKAMNKQINPTKGTK